MKRAARGIACAALWAAAGCGGPRPLVEGTGLHLEDSAKDGSGFAWRDLAGAVFAAAADGTARARVAAGADGVKYDVKYAAGVLTHRSGLDDTGAVAADVSARAVDGRMVALGHDVLTSSIAASADGARAVFFTVADAAAGTVDVHLADLSGDGAPPDGAPGGAPGGDRVIAAGALKAQARFVDEAGAAALVLAAKVPRAPGSTAAVEPVQVFDDAGVHALCDDHCARELAVTRGGRVLFFADDTAGAGDLVAVNAAGGPTALLATRVSDARIVLDAAETTAYVLTVDGGVAAVGLDGSGARTVVSAGAVDVVAAGAGFVVFAGAVDAATGLASLSAARVPADGSAPVALGDDAVAEGVTGDGSAFLFRDGRALDDHGHLAGRLHAFDGTQIVDVAPAVRKAQLAGADTVVFLDETKHLREAAGGPPAAWAAALVERNVDTFDVMGRAGERPVLLWSIAADDNAGIWRRDVP